MNRKLERKKNKLLRRREAKKLFIVPLAEPKPAPADISVAPAQVSAAPNLTPAQAVVLDELRKFHLDLGRLYARAIHRMMAQGLKEGRTPSSA